MLKKTTGAFVIFCVATGTMISSGLFILPAIVYLKAGPSIIIAYFFSALLVIPTLLSKSELATAMPKSGGTYFFVHRSLGAFVGTFAGEGYMNGYRDALDDVLVALGTSCNS